MLRAAAAAALVDSGPPEHAAELAKLVQGKLGGLPVEALFNTHWHPTHTGGNETLRGADTTIVAHELTRLWMSTEYYVDWEDRTYTPRAAAALPTQTFYATDPQPLVARVSATSKSSTAICPRPTPTATSMCCSSSATCS